MPMHLSPLKLPAMPTHFSLRIVHPAFELLKRSASFLHFIAASLIILNAVHQLQQLHSNQVLCYSQIFIGADIMILIFFAGAAVAEAPRLNLFFRFVEVIFLIGIGISLVDNGHLLMGWIHILFSGAYFFLFYREKRITKNESVDISQTGITIPDFLNDTEISWADVKSIIPRYHSIIIETLRNKKIQFQLRQNLKIEELEQIDEFCRKHVGS